MLQRRRVKCCFVGDYGVGKTSIMYSFLDRPLTKVQTTVGIDFFSKTICVSNTDIHLSLWDTAGAEKYRSLMHSYLRDADVTVIVYDLSKRESNIVRWMRVIEQHNAKVIGVLGNKNDLTKEFQDDLDDLLFPWSRQTLTILTGTCSSRDSQSVKSFIKKCLKSFVCQKIRDTGHVQIDLNVSKPKRSKCCT